MKPFAIAALCAATLAVSAAEDKKDAKGGGDQVFVTKASMSGLAEVNHGNLAARTASSADVKKFAGRMVTDHTKANKELIDLANKKSLRVAEDMGPKHKEMQDKLAKLSGAEFDKAYMAHMVEGHEKSVALFEKQSENGEDADLKKWAKEKLPTLREHLKMAREINKSLEGARKDAAAKE